MTQAQEKPKSDSISKETNPARVVICGPSRSALMQPLYILNGVEITSIATINPNNIQDMKVLKGAEATSVYGSKGKNGAIIITTKKQAPKNSTEE